MTTAEPRAAAAKLAISVAGGQIIRSVFARASAAAPATMRASSPAEAASPCIFQLPATSGRSAAAMLVPSRERLSEAPTRQSPREPILLVLQGSWRGSL